MPMAIAYLPKCLQPHSNSPSSKPPTVLSVGSINQSEALPEPREHTQTPARMAGEHVASLTNLNTASFRISVPSHEAFFHEPLHFLSACMIVPKAVPIRLVKHVCTTTRSPTDLAQSQTAVHEACRLFRASIDYWGVQAGSVQWR